MGFRTDKELAHALGLSAATIGYWRQANNMVTKRYKKAKKDPMFGEAGQPKMLVTEKQITELFDDQMFEDVVIRRSHRQVVA